MQSYYTTQITYNQFADLKKKRKCREQHLRKTIALFKLMLKLISNILNHYIHWIIYILDRIQFATTPTISAQILKWNKISEVD